MSLIRSEWNGRLVRHARIGGDHWSHFSDIVDVLPFPGCDLPRCLPVGTTAMIGDHRFTVGSMSRAELDWVVERGGTEEAYAFREFLRQEGWRSCGQ